MSEIIAFSSPKGGCGATFVCAGVWLSLARKGVSVFASDLCAERSALDFAVGFQDSSVLDISDVLGGFCNADDAMCLLPGFKNAAFVRGSLSSDIADFEKLGEFLSTVESDFILLDIPYNLIDAAVPFCTKLVLVTDCTKLSARMCERAASLSTAGCSVVINKIIPSYIENGIFPTVDEIVDAIGTPPVGLIPWSPSAVACFQSGIEAVFADRTLENIFDNISSRLEGRSVPAADFDMYYDCFKIKRRM